MRVDGGRHTPRLVVAYDDGEVTWDLSNPIAPALVQSLRAKDAHEKREDTRDPLVVHTGRNIATAPEPKLVRALESTSRRYGAAEVVGSPRLGGAKEALYVRCKDGARQFDITGDAEPREMHIYEEPAWFEGVAMGGTVLAKHDEQAGLMDIYVKAT